MGIKPPSFFNKLKKQRFKRNLVALVALYLILSLAILSLSGGINLLYSRKNAMDAGLAGLHFQVLEQALAAEKLAHTERSHAPSFSEEFILLCDQIWMESPQGAVLYASDMTALLPMINTYKNNIRFNSGHYGVLEYAQSRSQFLYRYRLSGGEILYCVIPTSALGVSQTPLFLFLAIMGMGSVLFLLIFCHFRKHVYMPVISIERAVDVAMEEDSSLILNIPLTNELYPLSQKVNNMLEQMREILTREYNSQILRKQSEINALQSQINPHFLYNTLDSIRGQALMQGSFEIANLLKSLSSIFRYSISKSSSLMPLRDELRHMDHYLTIQQYRFNNKFDVVKSFDGDEEKLLSYKMPKLTIQPIVENSVFHGLETKKGKGHISIHVYTTEKRLIVEIEDNGIGMEDEKLQEINRTMYAEVPPNVGEWDSGQGSSIALKNVNQRIQLLYGVDYGVRVYSTPGIGTRVEVVLPLIRDG